MIWNVSYQLFDFYTDAGPEYDGDNFVAKVQRRDIGLLGNTAIGYGGITIYHCLFSINFQWNILIIELNDTNQIASF